MYRLWDELPRDTLFTENFFLEITYEIMEKMQNAKYAVRERDVCIATYVIISCKLVSLIDLSRINSRLQRKGSGIEILVYEVETDRGGCKRCRITSTLLLLSVRDRSLQLTMTSLCPG